MNDLLGNKGTQDAIRGKKRPNQAALKPRPSPSVAAKKPNKINYGNSTPFDSIMNEIEAFDNTNKKKQKEKRARDQKSTDGGEEANIAGVSSSKLSSNLPPTPLPSSYISLTRAEVARSDEDSTMVRKFLKKDGLMERILGYKMMRGRVEPYNIIKLVVSLDDCVCPLYEQSAESLNVPEEKSNKSLSSQHPATSRVLEYCSNTSPKKSSCSPILNQPASLVRRGPQTPPGSPGPAAGHNNSSGSSTPHAEYGQEVGLKTGQKECTSLPPPPVFPNLSEKKEGTNDRTALLEQMAALTNTSIAQLEDFMGEDLQNAIGKIEKSVLLSTLKNALRDVTGQQLKQPKTDGQEPKIPDSSSMGGCEMDISSDQSNTEQNGRKADSYAFDSPLLPPPPVAPKPLSPPPPPPPMSTISQFAQPVVPPSFACVTTLFAPPPIVVTSFVSSTLPSGLQYSSPSKKSPIRISKKPAVLAGPIHPQRTATVNLDFIKSRPPPPIPEILKQQGLGLASQLEGMASTSTTPQQQVMPTANFTTPPPPFPALVPSNQQAALPVFPTHQPPPTIQQKHNTVVATALNKETHIYSSAPPHVNNSSSAHLYSSTTHVQPKPMQQSLSFTTPPPPFPPASSFLVPPLPTSQAVIHHPPGNLYQMPPPTINDRQQPCYKMDSTNIRPSSSIQPTAMPIQSFSSPPPNFSKLLPPPPIHFDAGTRPIGNPTSQNNGFQPSSSSRPVCNEHVHVPVPPLPTKMEMKVEAVEEESPIKAIHHHNQMFKTLMSALGTSNPESTNSNPQASIPSLLSSNYSPPSPLPPSKKSRGNGNRRDKNRRQQQQASKSRRKEAKKEAEQPPNIWDSIEM